MNKMTPGGLRPWQARYLSVTEVPHNIVSLRVTGRIVFVSLKLEGQSGARARELRLSKQAALTTAPGATPLLSLLKLMTQASGQSEHVGGKSLGMSRTLSLVLLNCFNCIFRHLKLKLLTQFPASNDEKSYYL